MPTVRLLPVADALPGEGSVEKSQKNVGEAEPQQAGSEPAFDHAPAKEAHPGSGECNPVSCAHWNHLGVSVPAPSAGYARRLQVHRRSALESLIKNELGRKSAPFA